MDAPINGLGNKIKRKLVMESGEEGEWMCSNVIQGSTALLLSKVTDLLESENII